MILNEHWFLTLDDARETIVSWRINYNRVRPHSALGYLPPAEFATGHASAESQKALPTFAQPRRRLRAAFAAKLKPECSHLRGLTEGDSSGTLTLQQIVWGLIPICRCTRFGKLPKG
jgi:hypothetical protein